jgi:phosphoribosylamine--glycine ligase
VGVVLTVPPFPYRHGYAELSRGLPIAFDPTIRSQYKDQLHFGEVALVDGQLVASGSIGYLMVATGAGATVEAAQQSAYDAARMVAVPNLRYRKDIGASFLAHGRTRLRALGFLP